MSAETERRRGGIPLLRNGLPNPLNWLPRPRLLINRSRNKGTNFASTSVTISESMMGSGSATSVSGNVTCTIASAGSATSVLSASAGNAVSRVPLKPASDVLCGALARAASQSTIHPIDTLKVSGLRRHGERKVVV